MKLFYTLFKPNSFFKFFFFLILLGGISPNGLCADENKSIELQASSQDFQRWCNPPVWDGLRVKWKGVRDLRPEKELATLDSNPPEKIYSKQPLEQVFAISIQDLLKQCGIQWVNNTESAVWEIEGVIEQFESGQQKGTFTSKTKGKSQIKIIAKQTNRTVEARVGYEIELKASRFKSFKKIESNLQELYLQTLQQLIRSHELHVLH